MYFYSNRTLCEVLEEMRKAVEVQDFRLLSSLYVEAVGCSMRMVAFAWSEEQYRAWLNKLCLLLGEPSLTGELETNREIIDGGRGEELLQIVYECLGNSNY